MAKELPYFKFQPSEWVTGDITLCSMEAQGLFINLCSYYWLKDCNISLANAQQRFSNCISLFKELESNCIFKINSDGMIVINFLDEQMEKFTDISVKRSESGKQRGQQKLSKSSAKAPYIEEDKEKNKKKIKIFIPPSLTEVQDYFVENGYTITSAMKAFKYYDVADWHDGKGDKIKNWKQKMQAVWFKDENKAMPELPQRKFVM